METYECKRCKTIIHTTHGVPENCVCGGKEFILLATLYPDLTEEELMDIRANLGDCYIKIQKVLSKYMDIPNPTKKFVAMWIIGTYFHEQLYSYPFLFFNAMRGSGKTRLLKLISYLAAGGNGKVINNVTEAVLFRIPKGQTTCIDEMESIGSKEKSTMRELLNTAYKKGGSVQRMKKVKIGGEEKQVVEHFEPYFPIAMANIWGMDEVLGDRALTFILEKSNDPTITKRMERFDEDCGIQYIKRTLEHLKLKKCRVVSFGAVKKDMYKGWDSYLDERYSTPTTLTTLTTHNDTNDTKLEEFEVFFKIDNLGITGRNLELLMPILIISRFIHRETFEEIILIGSEIMKGKKEDEYSDSKDVLLYDFISLENEGDLKPIKELTQRFRIFIGEGDTEDKWLNDKWFGKAIKRLNLILEKKRTNQGRWVILNSNKAKEKLKMFREEKVNDILPYPKG